MKAKRRYKIPNKIKDMENNLDLLFLSIIGIIKKNEIKEINARKLEMSPTNTALCTKLSI